MLSALALGLPAYVMIKVLHPSFFAREDTKTPMLYAGIAMVSTAILSFVLFMAIGGTGIAIATMLSGWINVGLLVATLKRRDSFKLDQTFRRRFAGICAASAVMGGVVLALVKLLAPWFAPASGLVAQAAALITLVGMGLVVYLAAAQLFGATKIYNIIKEIGG
jgi:putative peptidoglycan lipid II flippase